MKTIILFFFLTVQYFAQVQGCVFEGTLPTGAVNNHACRSAHEFVCFTVALADSADSLIVYSLTNKPDSLITAEDSVAVSMVDVSTGDDVDNGIITGDEVYHTYLIKWAYKRTNFKVWAKNAPSGATYTLEFY